jgi:hypothetical protein
MDYEQKQISCSENFQMAIDRCCEAQIDCVKQMAKATCEVWSSVMVCYVAGVTKGLGGVMKCYIAGVEGFYKNFETVGEDLCDKRAKVSKCEYHEPCMTSETSDMIVMAKAAQLEFDNAIETRAKELGEKKGIDTLAEFYKKLGIEAEKLGETKAREAKTECYKKLRTVAVELGHEKGIEGVAKYYKDLEAKAKELGDQMKK